MDNKKKTRGKYKKLSNLDSLKLAILHQEHKVSCYELVKWFGKDIPERTIYRHAQKPDGMKTLDDRERLMNERRESLRDHLANFAKKLQSSLQDAYLRRVTWHQRGSTKGMFSAVSVRTIIGIYSPGRKVC